MSDTAGDLRADAAVARMRSILADLGYPHGHVEWTERGLVVQQAGGRRPERNVPRAAIKQAFTIYEGHENDGAGS